VTVARQRTTAWPMWQWGRAPRSLTLRQSENINATPRLHFAIGPV